LLEEIEPMTHLLIEQEKRKVEFLGLVVSVLFCFKDRMGKMIYFLF
jgi:hypothetical protein